LPVLLPGEKIRRRIQGRATRYKTGIPPAVMIPSIAKQAHNTRTP
jgi:hypothetical protein